MNRLLVCGAVVLVLSACDGGGGTGPGADAGTFRFSHGGFLNIPAGTFDAHGRPTLDGSGAYGLGEWAAGEVGGGSAPMAVGGSQPSATGAGLYDVAVIELSRDPRTGDRFAFDICGGQPPELPCARMHVDFSRATSGPAQLPTCYMRSGVVRVTERTGDRIVGTVSGEASCGIVGATHPERVLITSGAFDVPVMNLIP